MYDTRPMPVMSGMRQSCSGMYPIRSRTAIPSAMPWPRTVAVPAVGCNRPSRSRKNVVLPAPLGPTRPIAPSGMATLRSSTARISPKTFVRPDVSTSIGTRLRRDGRLPLSPPKQQDDDQERRDRHEDEQEDVHER